MFSFFYDPQRLALARVLTDEQMLKVLQRIIDEEFVAFDREVSEFHAEFPTIPYEGFLGWFEGDIERFKQQILLVTNMLRDGASKRAREHVNRIVVVDGHRIHFYRIQLGWLRNCLTITQTAPL